MEKRIRRTINEIADGISLEEVKKRRLGEISKSESSETP